MNLWSFKSRYEKSKNSIHNKAYKDLNFDELLKDIEDMLGILQKSKAWLRDDNDCAEKLTGKLRQFRDLVVSLGRLVAPT